MTIDDWEVEEKKIEITEEQLEKAWELAQIELLRTSSWTTVLNRFKKELGF